MDPGLPARLSRLESLRAAKARIAASGSACDEGPYDSEQAIAGWDPAGVFTSDGDTFDGIDAIRDFFDGLAANFTLHIFTNVEETDSVGSATVTHCYGLEAPVLGDVAHFGAFTHSITQDHSSASPLIESWRQRIYLITPVLQGWVRGGMIADQTR